MKKFAYNITYYYNLFHFYQILAAIMRNVGNVSILCYFVSVKAPKLYNNYKYKLVHHGASGLPYSKQRLVYFYLLME